MSLPIQIQRHDDNQPDHYIVLLNDGVNQVDFLNRLTSLPNVTVNITHSFDARLLNGFTGTFDANALNYLCNSADVKSISEDGNVVEESAIVEGSRFDFWATTNHVPIQVFEQNNAPWGISRISQDGGEVYTTVTDLTFKYRYNWPHPMPPADIYIIDDGIKTDHEEFEGRARWGKVISGTKDDLGTGHGTHVAGIAGGKTYGVAKDVALIAVKTRGHSDRLKGCEWVWAQALASGRPTIANLSWGWPAEHPPDETALDITITNMVKDGIHVVIAAGNRDWNVEKTTPARVPSAITVGASDIDDYRWVRKPSVAGSNWGPGIDIFAPGHRIMSAGITSTTAKVEKTGTSMAAPHVSGLVAYLIALYGNKTPADMKAFLNALCLKGVLNQDDAHPLHESPNKLARNDVYNPQFQNEGVTVTNTGSKQLFFEAGNISISVVPTQKARLPPDQNPYKVSCIEQASAVEIAKIYYPSYASWEVVAGAVVKGAKFRSTVPMTDAISVDEKE